MKSSDWQLKTSCMTFLLHVLDTVKEPVEFSGPGAAVRFKELILKILEGLLFSLLDSERLAQVANVVNGFQLGNARR